MTKALAWDIMNKVVWPKVNELNLQKGTPMTIVSKLDMEHGVAISTAIGTVHVLGTGEIVDKDDVLGYEKLERNMAEFRGE